jgi:uncharacterized protein DUF5947
MISQLPLSGLKRLLDSDPAETSCQRCGTGLPAEHEHIVNIAVRRLLCVCPACYTEAARGSHGDPHRAVPRRYLAIPAAALTDEEWEALEIPVGIAFFLRSSALGRIVAMYPGAAGTTESRLSLGTGERALQSAPWMGQLTPDVEALLVRRTRDAQDTFLVPIDACYALAGEIRRHWIGFGGGAEVHRVIDSFFAALRDKCQVVTP